MIAPARHPHMPQRCLRRGRGRAFTAIRRSHLDRGFEHRGSIERPALLIRYRGRRTAKSSRRPRDPRRRQRDVRGEGKGSATARICRAVSSTPRVRAQTTHPWRASASRSPSDSPSTRDRALFPLTYLLTSAAPSSVIAAARAPPVDQMAGAGWRPRHPAPKLRQAKRLQPPNAGFHTPSYFISCLPVTLIA